MAANVETMFYTREKPWHGLGVQVDDAPTSEDALWLAGLGWKVLQKEIYTEGRIQIPGNKANVRDTDGRVLGVVTDRYKVIQNEKAFAFTKELTKRAKAPTRMPFLKWEVTNFYHHLTDMYRSIHAMSGEIGV